MLCFGIRLKKIILLLLLGIGIYFIVVYFSLPREPLVRQIISSSVNSHEVLAGEVSSGKKHGVAAPSLAVSPLDSVTPADGRDNIQWHADKGYFTSGLSTIGT